MALNAVQQVAQWWTKPENEAGDDMISTVKTIRINQYYRKYEDLLYASLYGGLTLNGFGLSANNASRLNTRGRLSLNVIRNMVGAVTSKIAAKSRPRPRYLTQGGNYDLKQKAQKLEKLVAGAFYVGGYYKERVGSFRNAAVFGTGPTKIFADYDTHQVAYERTMPWELVVDDGESVYGKPRTLYQRKYYDRSVLKAIYAKDDEEMAKALDTCAVDTTDMEYAYISTADQVLVTEAWHLPSGKDADDGRHVIAVAGVTLFDEKWDDDEFPFTFMRWDNPLEGFFGTGLAEELCGIQAEINKILRQIQRGMHLIAGHWLVEKGADVSTQLINNDLAAIVKYTGTPPQYQAPSIISPEIYSHLWQLYAKAFEIAGISQLNASGQKPAGLDAAVALREYQDIQTERFLDVGTRDEDCVLDAARLTVKAIKKLAASGGGYSVMSPGKNAMELIDYADIDIEDDSYIVQVYPTSSIPSSFAGKVQWVETMRDLGQVPPEDIMGMLDFPDTEAYAKRVGAARTLIERNISHMLTTGEVVTPEPYDNHPLAMRLVNEAYHEARLDEVDEERLQLLRDYMAATDALMNPPPPPPDPNAPVPGLVMGAPPPGAIPPEMGAPPMDPNMMPPPDAGMPPDMGPPPT